MNKWKKYVTSAMAIMMAAALMTSVLYAKTGTVTTTVEGQTTTSSDLAYNNWKISQWEQGEDQMKPCNDTGKAILTPGATENDLNIAWYSETRGTPAVKIATAKDLSDAQVIMGTAEAIEKTNSINSYTASNKVSMKNVIQQGTTYYYAYCDDIEANEPIWSEVYRYQSSEDFHHYSALLVGDPQIGASKNKDLDTYNWNKTISTATTMFPEASFILSAGDQVDASSANASMLREQQYAGYLYPEALRSYPVATTIGNHESLGDDYQLHYNNPNASDFGSTTAGGDYYYSYGNTLYIVLNTNNRNVAEHRQLMQEAVESDTDAQWKTVMFHHDIYGSASSHSDIDGANLRILFAPLMDEFDIDVCLTGHDHQYARTYQILDGKVIDYDGTSLVNPEGTMYITAGSASGSKYYTLNKTAQYYLAERVKNDTPSFSKLEISDESLTIITYDYEGNAYAGSFTIQKDENVPTSAQALMKEAAQINDGSLTDGSAKRLNSALAQMKNLLDTRDDTEAIAILTNEYDSSLGNDSGAHEGKELNYYGYAIKNNGKALLQGFSHLLDKTLYENNTNEAIAGTELANAKMTLAAAIRQKVTTAEVDAAKDQISLALAMMNEAEGGVNKGQYQAGSKALLRTAIDTAFLELSKEDLTKDELSKIMANIKAAVDVFKNSCIQEDQNGSSQDTQITPPSNESLDHTDNVNLDLTTSTSPNTGDDTNLWGYLIIALAGAATMVFMKVKEKHGMN